MESKVIKLSDIMAHPNMSLSANDYLVEDETVPTEMKTIVESLKGLAVHMRNMDISIDTKSLKELAENLKGGGGVGFDMECNLGEVMDIHTNKAMEMYNVNDTEVTAEMRRVAKKWNFIEAYSGGSEQSIPYLKEGFEKGKFVVMTARGNGKSLILDEWEKLQEAFRRSTEIHAVEQLPLEVLEKNAKKLRSRIRKEKNPGFIKTLRQELSGIEQEIYDFKRGI